MTTTHSWEMVAANHAAQDRVFKLHWGVLVCSHREGGAEEDQEACKGTVGGAQGG